MIRRGISLRKKYHLILVYDNHREILSMKVVNKYNKEFLIGSENYIKEMLVYICKNANREIVYNRFKVRYDGIQILKREVLLFD